MNSTTIQQNRTAKTINTKIHYVVKGEQTIFYPGDREKSYWPGEDHPVEITDLHSLDKLPTVEENGFTMFKHDTKITDYNDPQQIDHIFYPEMINLARQINKASKVIAFGHVARTDSLGSRQHLQPAYAAHVDYGRKTIEEYVHRIMGDEEAEYWLQKRVILMNFWRPIKTVYRAPLALCDASTVKREHLNHSEIRGGLDDPDRSPLWGWNLHYSPDHRWYYTSEMQPDEIYAFKLYDSDSSKPQWTGHTAVEIPDTTEDTPPRYSIEVRTISFVEK